MVDSHNIRRNILLIRNLNPIVLDILFGREYIGGERVVVDVFVLLLLLKIVVELRLVLVRSMDRARTAFSTSGTQSPVRVYDFVF